MTPWFTDKNFTSLDIRKDQSISDHTVVRSVTITDTDYIGKLAARIEKINPEGDMFKSFSEDAPRTILTFHTTTTIQVIDIIRQRFKTPSTAFNSINDYEKDLCAEIEALLFPQSPAAS